MPTYKRDDKEFKATLAKRADALKERAVRLPEIKAFQKTPEKIVTVTIEDDGSLLFLKTDSADIFLELGDVVTRRASHVEPLHLGYRVVFHILRMFGDDTKIAQWTRDWPVVWRVNLAPIGGEVLPEVFLDRKKAIDYEVKHVNRWLAERGTR